MRQLFKTIALILALTLSMSWRTALASPGVSGPAFVPGAVQVVPPLGGGRDDSVRMQSTITRAAARNACAQLTPGTYTIAHPVAVVANGCLFGTPSTRLHSTMTGGGGPGDTAASVLTSLVANPVGGQLNTVLSADTVDGSYTISTAAAPTVGMTLLIENLAVTNLAQSVTVQAVSGAGPFSSVLDKPTVHAEAFTAGAQVLQLDFPTNIWIDGRGMRVDGTGDRVVELGACQHCRVENITVPASARFNSIQMSFDIGGSYNEFRGIWIDGGNRSAGAVAAAGLGIESCYHCRVSHSHVQNVGTLNTHIGVYVVDSTETTLDDVTITGCYVGTEIASGSVASTLSGSRRTKVIGGAISSSIWVGAAVSDPDVDFEGTTFSHNVLGIQVSFGSTVSTLDGGPMRCTGCRGQANTSGLVGIVSGAVHLTDVISRDDGAGGVFPSSAAVWTGVGSVDVDVSIVGGSYTLTRDALWYGLYLGGSGWVTLDGGVTYQHPSAHTAAHASIVVQGASLLDLGSVTIRGTAVYGVYLYGFGATVRHGSSLTIASTALTPFTVEAGSTDSSWGAFFAP